MVDLPVINYSVVGALFTIVFTALAAVWTVNKAIIYSKSQ